MLQEWNMEPSVPCVSDLRDWLTDVGLEISLVLLSLAHQFHVGFKLAGVVRLREDALQKNRMRNADRLEEVH